MYNFVCRFWLKTYDKYLIKNIRHACLKRKYTRKIVYTSCLKSNGKVANNNLARR